MSFTTRAIFVGCALLIGACASTTRPEKPATTHEVAAAVSSAEVLPFIHDDYPKALAEAKAKNKPLFVDAWAPWCHSCLSLRSFVLTDPKLASLAPDFVWLSVDTEKDVNNEWLAKHPHSALPTLWVIDPTTDQPLLKWAGTATADELRALLQVSISKDNTGDKSETMAATMAFVRGNHALAAGDWELALKEHRSALSLAPKGHPHRARMVEALVTELSLHKDNAACSEVAAKEANDLPPGTSRASVIVEGLQCAREVKRTSDLDQLYAVALHDARDKTSPLLADDRSALYEEIFETRRQKDQADAKMIADEWAKFLEGEATRAKTNDARTSLDPLRLNAYLSLDQPGRAIPMLEQSEKDFPADYNPPARLGRVYLEMHRLDEAEKATKRAIERVYGPRAMRVYALSADIAKAKGDRAGEIAALEQALAKSDHSVLTEGQKGLREGLVKRLASLR